MSDFRFFEAINIFGAAYYCKNHLEELYQLIYIPPNCFKQGLKTLLNRRMLRSESVYLHIRH